MTDAENTLRELKGALESALPELRKDAAAATSDFDRGVAQGKLEQAQMVLGLIVVSEKQAEAEAANGAFIVRAPWPWG